MKSKKSKLMKCPSKRVFLLVLLGFCLNFSGALFAQDAEEMPVLNLFNMRFYMGIDSVSVYSPFLYNTNIPNNLNNSNKKLKTKEKSDKWNGSSEANWTMETTSAIDSWMADPNSFAMGADLSTEARYAILPIIDAGVSAENVPLAPAKMKNFVSIVKIARPMRFNLYGIVKPLDSIFKPEEKKCSLLIVRPEIGFSVPHPLDKESVSDLKTVLNWGLEAQVNLPALLSASVGIKKLDDVYNNYIMLMMTIGYIELDLGAGLHGSTFGGSWSGKGFNVVLGTKWGW